MNKFNLNLLNHFSVQSKKIFIINFKLFSQSSRITVPCGRDPLFCPLNTSQGTVCYRLQTEPFYWEQAVEECDAKYQSDLISIHSKEETNFIYDMVSSPFENFTILKNHIFVKFFMKENLLRLKFPKKREI